MIFSVATGVGLQKKIKEKISGFNGDIQISNYDSNNSKVTVNPITIHQKFYPDFSEVPNVKKIQPFATKAGIDTPGAVAGLVGFLGAGMGAYAKVKSDVKKQGG